jgi:hypothetical protein
MATRTTEMIDGVEWIVYNIENGETIDTIRDEYGEEPWMACFVSGEELYTMTFKFEPISGQYMLNGFIQNDPVEVFGNINNMI